jgi:hypothetical protein
MPIRPGSDDVPPQPGPDAPLSRFREGIAALIAVVVVAASLTLLFLGFGHIGEKEQFDRAKDLLLIVNPVLGVVIGDYFNKVSTEARAENAENTARHATADLRKAAEERQQAQAVAAAAKTDAEDTRGALEDLSRAAERVLAEKPIRSAGILSGPEGGLAADDPRKELEEALARARRKGALRR